MKDALSLKLYSYITQHNPELLIAHSVEGSIEKYIFDKVATAEGLIEQLQADNTPGYIIEEQALEYLTADLRPSKFSYLLTILEEEFPGAYNKIKESGVLAYEVINLIEICAPVFDELHFNESNEDDRAVKYAITGAVSEYLK